ncbi:hypothetical protein Micbo1qcDRAFT_184499 [Microdochium bolleyi]|uniref:DUF1772-domain-containing protein n=1 Tax=Microdochium bolleyi TaxID=196109 RepID=A0A136IY01_9PEZI|nr:hypothetical protein Micbo1qcDRAFT_184499 [Microdochium bolleyi]
MAAIIPYLPALKGIAIAGSLINGGTMTSGYRLLPAVYPQVPKNPKDAAKQWEFFYWSMSATVPWVDLTTIIAIGTIAYTEYSQLAPTSASAAATWKIWTASAALMPVGWVWVRQVMLVPSYKLLAIAKDTADGLDAETAPFFKAGPQETLDLMKKFNSEMGFRMMFPWVVGGLALWATLGF